MRSGRVILITAVWLVAFAPMRSQTGLAQSRRAGRIDDAGSRALDVRLARVLEQAGFTGEVESTLERRLGRPIDRKLADLGRLLWSDTLHSLHHDNTCGGCHSPTNGFGDSQGMAIGIQHNSLVGADSRRLRTQP